MATMVGLRAATDNLNESELNARGLQLQLSMMKPNISPRQLTWFSKIYGLVGFLRYQFYFYFPQFYANHHCVYCHSGFGDWPLWLLPVSGCL